MSNGPDGYSTGLIWDNEPGIVPKNAVVMRISAIAQIPETWAFTASIVEGPRDMIGKRLNFVPMNLNSCVGFGSQEGYVVASRTPVELPSKRGAISALEVIDYSPTIMNEVVRVLFGGSQWRYPGKPSNRFVWPE